MRTLVYNKGYEWSQINFPIPLGKCLIPSHQSKKQKKYLTLQVDEINLAGVCVEINFHPLPPWVTPQPLRHGGIQNIQQMCKYAVLTFYKVGIVLFVIPRPKQIFLCYVLSPYLAPKHQAFVES